MSVEFVCLELCCPPTPQPKCYLSRNEFEVGQVTKRLTFMRTRPLKRKQENCLFSVNSYKPYSRKFGGGEIQGQAVLN